MIFIYNRNYNHEDIYSEYNELLGFYNKLDEKLNEIYKPLGDCGGCNKCCRYPYFYMCLYKPEFQLLQQYIKENKIPIRIKFESFPGVKLDKRIYHKNWICPLYRREGGCGVYPVRPVACRFFGVFMPEMGRIEDCVYKEPIMYQYVDDNPLWKEFQEVLSRWEEPQYGYIFTDSSLYKFPVVEFLMNMELPWGFKQDFK